MICYINLSFRFWLPVQRQQTGLDLQRLPAFRCSTSSSLFTSAAFSRKARQTVSPLHLFLVVSVSASDYFSLKSGSRPSSKVPSPAPSVAGSVTSSSGSGRLRRPLISPARLNISGQKLRLFSTEREPHLMSPPASPSHYYVEPTPSVYSGCFSCDVSPFQSQNGA